MLVRWDLKTAIAAAFRSAHPDFVPFGRFVEDCAQLVRPFDTPDKVWPVYGVNNHSGVFLSHRQPGKSFNAPYKRIRKDWFFHNPTRANVGSIGRVPAVEDDAITSPEYQVWRIKDPNWLPDFVELLVRAEFFNRLVQVHRVGTVKERLYTENLMEIPVPNCRPELQHRLADAWDTARLMAERFEAEAATTEEELSLRLARALGLSSSGALSTTRAFALRWSAIDRWGTQVNQPAAKLSVDNGIYPVASLGELIHDLENGWSPKCLDRPAQDDEWGVLKLGAVSFGVYDPDENKALPASLAAVPELQVRPGDWLISRANITRLVGACALVANSPPRRMLCDKIFRAVWRDDAPVIPAYLNEAMKLPHLRQQIEAALTGSSPTMKNISKPALLALRLPSPPLAVQHELVADMQAARRRASQLRGEADTLRTKARAALEAALLGHPLPELASMPHA